MLHTFKYICFINKTCYKRTLYYSEIVYHQTEDFCLRGKKVTSFVFIKELSVLNNEGRQTRDVNEIGK